MIDELQAFLLSGETSNVLLFIGIILLSYLLEDLAIVTAGTLAAQGSMLPSVALFAIFIGIASGDLGLYCLGRVGRRVRVLRYKALTNRHFKVMRARFHRGAFFNLFVIRFIPGMRSVGFTLSGFFTIPLSIFLCAVISATAIWTTLVFFAIYYLGSQAWMQASHLQWLIVPFAIALLFFVNRFLNHSLSKGHA
ncbi:DedA family protein [Vibrio sp. RC27]